MSQAHISPEQWQRIAADARHRCGYCQTQEAIAGMPFEIEHIVPRKLGGSSDESNLWLACPRCNRFKGDRTHGLDTVTQTSAPLFNPRRQVWQDHFAWADGGVTIVGLTATGRATVYVLQMNNPYVTRARYVWVTWGWHPPHD